MATPKKLIKKTIALNVDVLVDGVVKTELKQFEYNPLGQKGSGRLLVSINTKERKDGRYVYVQKTGKTERELRQNIVKYYEDLLEEQLKKSEKLYDKPLKEVISEWLKHRHMKATSRDAEEDVLVAHVYPAIGAMLIRDIKPSHIQKIINGMIDENYAYSYIKKPYVYLNTFFIAKIKTEELTYNPCVGVELPKEREIKKRRTDAGIKKKPKYFTKEQVKTIQDIIYNGYEPTAVSRSGNTYKRKRKCIYQGEAFDFMLQTGIRAGEMCGLKYSDWDPKKQTVIIAENLVPVKERDKNGERTGKTITASQTPKTDESEAVLHISDKANSILKSMQAKEAEGYDGYIIHTQPDKNGSFHKMDRTGLRGRYHRILIAAGIETKDKEEYGLHVLRHTTASFIYAATHDMQLVSKKLRHSDPAITAKTYVDLLPDNVEDFDKRFEI